MSLGALTATFSPPASCTESFGHAYLLGTQFAPTYYGPATTDGCFPRNYIAARDAYYSPGVCPAAYTSACSSTNVIGSLTETAITCCPTGFDCNTQLEFSWETTLLCSSSYALTTTQTIPVTFLGTRGSIVRISTDTAATAGGMNAFGYQVRFQSTDFQPTETSTSSTNSASAGSQTSSAGGSGGPTTGPASGGLSSGAAAGIGVGATAAVILLGAGIALFIYRKRKRAKLERQSALGNGGTYPPNAYETQENKDYPVQTHSGYLGTGQYPHMNNSPSPTELSGPVAYSRPVAELSEAPYR